ncbi:E3 ubiquitin-protein ligase RNF216, partial [Neolecta irregularis DAH-3]
TTPSTSTHIRAIRAVLPDIDPAYLLHCLSHYRHNHVQRVVEKILLNNAHYPTVSAAPPRSSVHLRNDRLLLLNLAFPHVDVDALRRKIADNPHLPLDTIAESIIAADASLPKRPEPGRLDPWERFRSSSYIHAAKQQLSLEFPDLAGPQINAIMAESNYDYFKSREKLPSVQPAWWHRLKNYVGMSHRKPVQFSLSNMPSTGCPDLDIQIGSIVRLHAVERDREFALKLNRREYDRFKSNIECECCYGDFPWEEMTCCTQGHLFCQDCLVRFVKEGLFVQGNLRGAERIHCLSSAAACDAFISPVLVDLALPSDIKKTFYDCYAQSCLDKSGLPLVRCQFCGYAEIQQTLQITLRDIAIKLPGFLLPVALALTVPALTICLLFIAALFAASQLLRLAAMSASPSHLWHSLHRRLVDTFTKVARDKRGSVFSCQNESCKRKTCFTCEREWLPLHKCFEEENQKLRLYIEKAMADAIKRTCPNCNISFVKLDGCNKLVCPCGYAMCYICRKDIRIEGYRHFCQHFRALRGVKCSEGCGKCDLYQVEDEAKILQDARDRAIAEYTSLNAHPAFQTRSMQVRAGPPVNDIFDGDSLINSLELALYKIIDIIMT